MTSYDVVTTYAFHVYVFHSYAYLFLLSHSFTSFPFRRTHNRSHEGQDKSFAILYRQDKTIFGRGVESSPAHTEELDTTTSTATSPSTALSMLSSYQSTPRLYNGLSALSIRKDARSLSPSSSSKGTSRWSRYPLWNPQDCTILPLIEDAPVLKATLTRSDVRPDTLSGK